MRFLPSPPPLHPRVLLLSGLLALGTACKGPNGEGLRPGHSVALLGGLAGAVDPELRGASAGIQYRFQRQWLNHRPIVGAVLYEGGGRFVYGGLGPEIDITRRLRLTNSFSVGVYRAGQIDLGGTVQFRSAVGLSYALNDSLRLGLMGSHLSHAGFGGATNPGTESVFLSLGWGF